MKCSTCSKRVEPVVVCDIDGTLSQYHEHLTNFCHLYFNRSVPTYPYDGSIPFRDYLGLTQAEHRAMKLAYRQGGNKRFVPPYELACSMARELPAYGTEIWVATTRPFDRLDNVDPDTREWLRRQQITIDGLLFGEDKYEQLIATIDPRRIVAVFEDLPEQFAIGHDSGLPMFMLHRPHNSSNRSFGGNEQTALYFAINAINEWRRQYE